MARKSRCVSRNRNIAYIINSLRWSGRRDSNPRPSVLGQMRYRNAGAWPRCDPDISIDLVLMSRRVFGGFPRGKKRYWPESRRELEHSRLEISSRVVDRLVFYPEVSAFRSEYDFVLSILWDGDQNAVAANSPDSARGRRPNGPRESRDGSALPHFGGPLAFTGFDRLH